MSKLEKLAIRIGEISNEIYAQKQQRFISLDKCHGSDDDEFEPPLKGEFDFDFDNCLTRAYQWVKSNREDNIHSSFDEIINMYGCANCIGAHKAKRKIGSLKQERGRIVGNISKIGKLL